MVAKAIIDEVLDFDQEKSAQLVRAHLNQYQGRGQLEHPGRRSTGERVFCH